MKKRILLTVLIVVPFAAALDNPILSFTGVPTRIKETDSKNTARIVLTTYEADWSVTETRGITDP